MGTDVAVTVVAVGGTAVDVGAAVGVWHAANKTAAIATKMTILFTSLLNTYVLLYWTLAIITLTA
jgi:hypothetical protein